MDEHLTDVRDSFPNDKNAQHFLLQNSVPDRFHAVCAKNMPKEDYIKSTLGLDLLTVVIRYLYCFLNPKFLALDDMDGGSERRLIRWTWSNFSEDATKHHPSHAIRYSILKSYYPGGALRGNDLSFLALEEHDITYNSFWRRAPFLLFAPFHIQRATDSSSWHHSPVRNLVGLKVLARDSLVHWNGQSNLGELISSRFGVAEYGQAQYLWTSNKPAIIRVLLRPEADMPGAFEQFREISVDCPQLTQVEENENFEEARGPTDEADERERNYDLPHTGESMVNYKLVAVVVCDSQNESVHLYSSEGEPITPQRFQREGQCFSLGATGKDYMLFYVRAPSRPNQRPAYREVTKEFYELEVNMEGVYRTLRHQESPEAGADQEKSGRGKRNRTSSSASDTCRNAEVRTQGDAKFATRA